MAGAFKKVAGYLGLMDEEELDHGTNQTAQRSPRLVRSENKRLNHSNVELLPHADSNKIMDHIISLTPRTYSEARLIGEHYRQGKPVIMNLSDMEETERKRLVDFASGLVFGHHGSIERVTPKVFLLTPPNVSVSVEDKNSAAQASFFNQS
ncbi:MAG: cell division protein SepF [Actinobacteria bacterium]|nr:cell division protein SepF [Actinomycetota bacterium]